LNEADDKRLLEAATVARLRSVAPFSKFLVGAAVQTREGKIYTGCNIESASYSSTVCAERVAIWKAVSEGERNLTNLAIVVDTEPLTPPCGSCRQIIWEFCNDGYIILANLDGHSERVEIRELQPRAFDARFLQLKHN
jgi:cytidine deaminase